MPAEQNKAFIRRYFDALSGKEKTEGLLQQFITSPALREHIAASEAAFPRYRLEPQDIIAENDKVVVRFTGGGTHQGEFFGVPPTGREITFEGIIIYRIEDGKIAEHWMQIDGASVMQQLTTEMPAPA